MWPILLTGDAKRKTGVHEEKRNQLGAIHLGGRQGTLTDSEKSKTDMLGGCRRSSWGTAIYTKNGTQAGDGEHLANRAVSSVSQSKTKQKSPLDLGMLN